MERPHNVSLHNRPSTCPRAGYRVAYSGDSIHVDSVLSLTPYDLLWSHHSKVPSVRNPPSKGAELTDLGTMVLHLPRRWKMNRFQGIYPGRTFSFSGWQMEKLSPRNQSQRKDTLLNLTKEDKSPFLEIHHVANLERRPRGPFKTKRRLYFYSRMLWSYHSFQKMKIGK